MSLADTYFKLEVKDILKNGVSDVDEVVRAHWPDGTPAHSLKTFGVVRRFDLSDEFPILTIRKQAFNNCVKELLWMWQKKSNNINDLPCPKIWAPWADGEGSIGKTYGYQLGKTRVMPTIGIGDQVDYLIFNLKNNPTSRRLVVDMWNADDLCDMNLAPCVCTTMWDVSNGKLNLSVIQRSGDLLVAAGAGGWDTIQYAVLQSMLAQVCGLQVGELIHYVNNLHIYDRHIFECELVSMQDSYPAPKLWLNPDITDFYDFSADDIKLIDYKAQTSYSKFEVAI